MANVFVHFEPIGPLGEQIVLNPDLPQYIIRGSEQEQHWRLENRKGYKLQSPITEGTTSLHHAAFKGNAASVERLLNENPNEIHKRDGNGWAPIHEAVRSGSIETIKVLLKHGADINMATNGNVMTPLYWAIEIHGEDHPVVSFLKQNGAKVSLSATAGDEL